MIRNESFLGALVGDGRPLLVVVALVLLGSGAFAIFQAATGHFLPHDTEYLGMTAKQLCSLHGCRIVHFMIHDRISFGGVLIAIGVMYLWLIEFPLRMEDRHSRLPTPDIRQAGDGQAGVRVLNEHAWAWWTIAISGGAGFLSFLTYLGYGYLDTWHGLSTLALLPIFIWGLARTYRGRASWAAGAPMSAGRLCLLLATLAIVFGGLTIMTVGMTSVFVPQDLEFMGIDVDEVRAIHRNLVPLIAHDRAGFGGGLASCGLAMLLAVWCAPMSRSLWQALLIAGVAGFGTAIGVHPAIGYLSFVHLAPAILGALTYAIGLALSRRFEPFAERAGIAMT